MQKNVLTNVLLFLILIALIPNALQAFSQANGPTSFTYQGELQNSGVLANGDFDLAFDLYDAASGGTLIAGPISQTVTITNGVFHTVLDFGVGVFDGDARYLEMSVRPTGMGAYTTLTPRQLITAVPYAVYSSNVDWSGIANAPTGIWETVNANSGTTTADIISDTLTIVGSGTVSTNISGDTLTINGSNNVTWDDVANRPTGIWENVNADLGSATADTISDTLSVVGSGTVSTNISGDTLTINGNVTWNDVANRPAGVWETITADSGSTSATTISDTLTIVGGAGISTALIGDVLTISSSGGGDNLGNHTATQNVIVNGYDVIIDNGYLKLPLTTGAPPATDCNESTEWGRIVIDPTTSVMWVCINAIGGTWVTNT